MVTYQATFQSWGEMSGSRSDADDVFRASGTVTGHAPLSPRIYPSGSPRNQIVAWPSLFRLTYTFLFGLHGVSSLT
jgi:hypothetical protein